MDKHEGSTIDTIKVPTQVAKEIKLYAALMGMDEEELLRRAWDEYIAARRILDRE